MIENRQCSQSRAMGVSRKQFLLFGKSRGDLGTDELINHMQVRALQTSEAETILAETATLALWQSLDEAVSVRRRISGERKKLPGPLFWKGREDIWRISSRVKFLWILCVYLTDYYSFGMTLENDFFSLVINVLEKRESICTCRGIFVFSEME